MVIKLDKKKKICTVANAPGPGQNFVTLMLTCDLFAVGNLVVRRPHRHGCDVVPNPIVSGVLFTTRRYA